MYPENAPAYDVAVGCEVHGDAAVMAAQADELQSLMSPAPARQIEAWIAELAAVSLSRNRDGLDVELAMSALTSRLSRYPADVAKAATVGWPWKWFPSWAELEAVCERLTAPRRLMIKALREGPPKPGPEYVPPTDEEKQRIAELISEKFPDVPQAWRDAAIAHETRARLQGEGGAT